MANDTLKTVVELLAPMSSRVGEAIGNIKRGLRSFELIKSELREGQIDISLGASVSRYSP